MYKPTFRTNKKGVPILKNEEIDDIAEHVLRDYNEQLLNNPARIDLDKFVSKHLDLEQDFQYLTHNGTIWGMMIFNNTNKVPVFDVDTCRAEYISARKGTILVYNRLLEEDKEVQYRSTVAHEAGHWVLHSGVFAEDENQLSIFDYLGEQQRTEPIIQCRNMDISYSDKEAYKGLKTDEEWMEHQAKYFSAAFLMPKSTMNTFCNDLERRCRIIMDYKGFENNALTKMVAEYFNVSFSSAAIRIKQLHLNFRDIRTF